MTDPTSLEVAEVVGSGCIVYSGDVGVVVCIDEDEVVEAVDERKA